MGFVRRRTRRRTALVVGGAAYAAGRHQGRKAAEADAYEEEEYAPEEEAPQSAPTDAEQLQKLAELHAAGSITDEEYAAAKAKVLGI